MIRRYQIQADQGPPSFFGPENITVDKWFQPMQEPRRFHREVPALYREFQALWPFPQPNWWPGPREGEFSGDLSPRAYYFSLSPGGVITEVLKPDAGLNLGSDPQRSLVQS